LYVWVNGAEVSVASARVQQAADMNTTHADVSVRPGSAILKGSPGAPLPVATARLRRHARERKSSVTDDFSRLSSAAAIFGSRPPSEPMGHLLGGSAVNQPASIYLEIDIPADLLHQGINTLACTLVPGPRQRRIERAVSFLVTQARTPPRGKPVMPEVRRQVVLADDLRAVLEARGVKAPEAAQRRMAFRTLESGQWSLPCSTLKKNVGESRKTITQQLDGAADRLRGLRQGSADGRMRPTKAQPHEREDMPSNSSVEALR